MARQPRIEFPGAFYHVMCRGDRREPIFEDDEDRSMFLQTLGECCERSGWRVYAWVLMSNHYHWVIQTPEANLVAGMKWFQNTYTRRLNTRHSLWGHVFGGRYKAILVDASGGGYLETLMDYVHLNPVRAGLVETDSKMGLLEYHWSSLAQGYGIYASQRPVWLAVQEGLELFGYRDEARDRRKFIERLEKRARENGGHVEGPHAGLQNTLQRGWYWGSQEFREKMLKLAQRATANRNYHSSQLGREKDRKDAQFWIQKAGAHFEIDAESLRDGPRAARLAAAWAIHLKTNQPQKWVADALGFHSAANVSQQVRRIDSPAPPPATQTPLWKKWRAFVKNC
jgi:REP element-mobilizing transposase RayT